MGARRTSYESGHTPKFLVVVDETPECDCAIYFGARRAVRTGAALVLLAVADPSRSHDWLGVGELIAKDAEDACWELLKRAAKRAHDISGIDAEASVRLGARSEQILLLIEEDRDIAFLVLAASSSSEGPGPLILNLVAKSSVNFPIPVVIVPEKMDDDEIDSIA
jgi:nucleotide-binding universal stress UspA family protein